jgi:hypothetical protein
VNWKPEWSDQQHRWDKPPVSGETGYRIDATNPSNLKSMENVLAAQEKAEAAFLQGVSNI